MSSQKTLLLLFFLTTQLSLSQPTPQQREDARRVLTAPNLAMDLMMAFDKEKILGPEYGQARAAATRNFLINRGMDPSLIEVRHNVVSQFLPYLVFPKLFDDGQDMYLFPSANEQLIKNNSKPYAFLPTWGTLNQIAYQSSLINDTTVETEEKKLRLITDSAGKTDISRFENSFSTLGKSPFETFKTFLKTCKRALGF